MHTNQEAEFLALIEGMKLCATRGYQSVSFRTDSDIVERATELEMVKNKMFQPFVEEIIRLKAAFPLFSSNGYRASKTKKPIFWQKKRFG